MLTELGHYALILATCLAALQVVFGFWGAQRRHLGLMQATDQATLVGFALVLFSFAALMQAYIASDFSLLMVWKNSHQDKPLIYRIAGTWGNHEGSLLLWTLILTLFSACLVLAGRGLPTTLKARVLAVQGVIALGFLSFMVLTSNPFLRQATLPMDGEGLNPLLQDIGLALHPPMLYLGYVGFSMAFSFAVAALIEGRVDPAWGRWVRPWTLAAWVFLTAGITLGSWWAYYELGWGGWWFWDPVENVSFMPWLSGTALLHCAIVVEKRDAMKVWTILFAVLTFSLSLVGTFIVRSGLLTSVHAFAVDPERGRYILMLLALSIGGSLILFAIRAPIFKPGGIFAPISREGALLINNILLAIAAAIVFYGTLWPLVVEALSGQKITVAGPFYDRTFVPIMVPVIILMGVGPFLTWKRADAAAVAQRLGLVFGITVLAVIALLVLRRGGAWLPYVGIGLAVWLIAAAAVEWLDRVGLLKGKFAGVWQRIARTPNAAHGMSLAHAGLGIAIIGMVGSTSWSLETITAMAPGETADLGQHCVRYNGVSQAKGPNYTAQVGDLTVMRDCAQDWLALAPEKRAYPVRAMGTTEAAIISRWNGDFYAALGDEQDGKRVVRLYFRAYVPWIWLGGIVMVIGGLFSLSDRRLRLGIPRRVKSAEASASRPGLGGQGDSVAARGAQS